MSIDTIEDKPSRHISLKSNSKISFVLGHGLMEEAIDIIVYEEPCKNSIKSIAITIFVIKSPNLPSSSIRKDDF